MLKIHPINTSFKDPDNCVYIDEYGKILRKINIEFISYFKQSQYFTKINKQCEDGFFEIDKFQFQTYYHEYPFELFKDSALNFLNCLEDLIQNDLIYVDGNPLNSTYVGKNQFLHFDFGSIKRLDLSSGWTGYHQFLTEWLWLLYHLSDKEYIPAGYLTPYFNDNQWLFSESIKFRHKLRPSFWVHHAFLQNQKKSSLIQKNSTNKSHSTISKNKLLAFVELLKSDVRSVKMSKKKSKWDNYYTETVLQNDYLKLKEEKFIYLLKSNRFKGSEYFIDWGANDGVFSRLICETHPNAHVISIESDFNAANDLYTKSKAYNIIPIHANILNPTPAIGFSNNYPSLLERISKIAHVHVALGLIHHLQHTHNLSHEEIIDFFATNSLSSSFLIIEFIAENDPRYQLIRNPNYPYPESIENFQMALEKKYVIIEKIQLTNERTLFFAQKEVI